jgi:flagellar hook-associated protein 1 FlgK
MGADLLSIGKTALNASKKSLETSSHNISNANTEGFSRQKVNLQTNIPIAEGNVVMGNGVHVKSIKRVHDELVEKRLNDTINHNSFQDERVQQLAQIEDIFNEVNSEGMNKIVNKFFNSFRELANQPENETMRSIVRENANMIVNDFKRQNEMLSGIEANVDRKLEASVSDINLMVDQVSKLSKEITSLEIAHQETGDLRDQRDTLIRSLSEYFNLKTYETNNGQFVLNAAGVGTLVSGTDVQHLKVGAAKDIDSTSRPKLEIFLESKPSAPITTKLAGGKIEALQKTREVDLKNTRDQVNKLAYNLVKATNAIHRQGFINKDVIQTPDGRFIASDGSQASGINFFEDLDSIDRAAEYIDLSFEVQESVSNIATGLEPNKPGDNRVALAISKLQHEKIIDNGTTSFEEHHLKTVSNLGLASSKARIDFEQSSGMLAQAKSVKERISGVSIDEETANMVKYQQAYEASARVIRVADEMFKSVLSIMDR